MGGTRLGEHRQGQHSWCKGLAGKSRSGAAARGLEATRSGDGGEGGTGAQDGVQRGDQRPQRMMLLAIRGHPRVSGRSVSRGILALSGCPVDLLVSDDESGKTTVVVSLNRRGSEAVVLLF